MKERQSRAPKTPRKPKGRIITFYSYKGGTGRTMSLANVAWILASNGMRVLTIDWDFEAPGLHRYFQPFLQDKELHNSSGLIDFFSDFVLGAHSQGKAAGREWFEPYTHLARHAVSLDWEFPDKGTVDFIPAGRQGPSYASFVNRFDWGGFYEKLGGGVFLEAVKRNLRAEYDYILIDSRTGISDTSGICTIQMPDELVVCFTLNNQSIRGVAGTAESAFSQRMTPSRKPGLKVWPVPTRVEPGEKDRLERARKEFRDRFQKFLYKMSPRQRNDYWGAVEVAYQPFFAYEEILAVLAERRGQKGSLLSSFEALTRYLTGGEIRELGCIDEEKRARIVDQVSAAPIGPCFLSYSTKDREFADRLVESLDRSLGGNVITRDTNILRGGDHMEATLSSAISKADAVLLLLSENYVNTQWALREASYALSRGQRIIPILTPGFEWSSLTSKRAPLPEISRIFGFTFKSVEGSESPTGEFESEVLRLSDFLRQSMMSRSRTTNFDEDDPHRGRFGGDSERDGFRLTAKVTTIDDDWFDLELAVQGDSHVPVREVEFHLHPTFEPSQVRVKGKGSVARYATTVWGAFTVGAIVLDTLTALELDLAALKSAPKAFRER